MQPRSRYPFQVRTRKSLTCGLSTSIAHATFRKQIVICFSNGVITMIKHLFAAIFTIGICSVSAQYTANDQLTADQLVQEIFQGTGVSISNVTINGLPDTTMSTSMGSYTYEGDLPIPPVGIILSNSSIHPTGGFGSGYSNDPDLLQLSNATSVNDVMALEFDFVPEEDTMIFEFVFGSTEYANFTCSYFNDVFGFFLSGPGISGPFQNNAVNIALVPNTQVPISINTINSGIAENYDSTYCYLADPNWQANSIYFVEDTTLSVLWFNGMTVLLQAKHVLVPGETYHIKLAVADASDFAWNSAVFLKAGSFRSVGGFTTHLREQEEQRLHAWFNGNGDLVIDTDSEEVSQVRLLDLHGKTVMDRSIRSAGITSIAMPSIVPGIYHVEAIINGRAHHTRLIR